MARHYTDDDLTLYYFGEGRRPDRIERHLADCRSCQAAFDDLSATLDAIGSDAPPRGERYGLEVWQRIRHELPAQEPAPWTRWTRPAMLKMAGLALFAMAAFAGGRLYRPAAPVPEPASDRLAAGAADRARFAAIGDHLERSERVLLDLVNAPRDAADIADEQRWARDLLGANRLYREAAVQAGEEDIALVLDDLERGLLDIVHEPVSITPGRRASLPLRLDAAALLFKLRVLADDLRERERAPMPAPGATT